MRLRDISLRDVQQGKNWRFVEPPTSKSMAAPLPDWGSIVECAEFDAQDLVVYSGLILLSSGDALPTLAVKQVGDLDYGGDHCVFVGGSWQELGPHLNLGADVREEFLANPLEIDPSFDALDHDDRERHRKGFREHTSRLSIGQ